MFTSEGNPELIPSGVCDCSAFMVNLVQCTVYTYLVAYLRSLKHVDGVQIHLKLEGRKKILKGLFT